MKFVFICLLSATQIKLFAVEYLGSYGHSFEIVFKHLMKNKTYFWNILFLRHVMEIHNCPWQIHLCFQFWNTELLFSSEKSKGMSFNMGNKI